MKRYIITLLIDGKNWTTSEEAPRLFDAQHIAIDKARILQPKAVIKVTDKNTCMKELGNSPEFPKGAEYAMLTRDGEKIQGFYKYVEEAYNDGTKEMRLYHKSSLPVWQPSSYTFEEVLALGFEIVSINHKAQSL